MDTEKLQFLKNDFFIKLKNLTAQTNANWGVMNAQQMVEHLIDFYSISIEKMPVQLYTAVEQLPLYKAFLLSDKSFKENTKAPVALLGDIPLPLRAPSLEAAIEKLYATVILFENYFEGDAEKTTLHPVFGLLNFDEWVLLHYKHVTHHLKQFNLM